MTKMQIIAKTALTFLGLSAIASFGSHLSTLTAPTQTQGASTLRIISFLLVVILLIIVIAYFLIFKNDRLVCKMAEAGEKLNPEDEAIWLTGSLRMVAVLYGLILLATSMPTILNIIVSPLYIRTLINEILTFKAFPKSLIFTSYQWSYMTYNFLKAILAVYLLYGWPHFVRFQLNIRKTTSPFNKNLHVKGIQK